MDKLSTNALEENLTQKPKSEAPELPDMYIPLSRQEVLYATGLTYRVLKRMILSRPDQFGPGVAQVFSDGRKTLIRFNPMRHLEYIRSREPWEEHRKALGHTIAATSAMSNGPTGPAGKSVTDLEQLMEYLSARGIRKKKLNSQQQQTTINGSDYLRQLRGRPGRDKQR